MGKYALLLFCLFVQSLVFGEPCSQHLTLEDCIVRAKVYSKAIEGAEFDTLAAVANKNIVRSNFFPHVDVEGVIDNSNKSLSDDLTQFQEFKSNKVVGIKAIWGILDFGVTWRRFKASQLRIDVTENEKQRLCLEIEEQVKAAYFSILETEKILHVLEQSLITLQSQCRQMADRMDEGLVRQADLLAMQVQVTIQEKALIQAQNSLASQKMALNRMMGIPLQDPICLEEIAENSPCIFYDQAFDFALRHRPDVLAFHKEMQALCLERKALLWSVAPRFYLFANGNTSFPKSSISAGLGMNMSLYHGGAKSAEILKVDAAIGKLEALIQESYDTIALELKTLFLDLDEIRMNLLLSEKSIALAERQVVDAQDLFVQGFLPIQNVLLTQDQVNEAKMSYLTNFYRLHQAYARLYTLTGGYPHLQYEGSV